MRTDGQTHRQTDVTKLIVTFSIVRTCLKTATKFMSAHLCWYKIISSLVDKIKFDIADHSVSGVLRSFRIQGKINVSGTRPNKVLRWKGEEVTFSWDRQRELFSEHRTSRLRFVSACLFSTDGPRCSFRKVVLFLQHDRKGKVMIPFKWHCNL
jgi:hypothetical protein